MSTTKTGKCLCGAVTFSADIPNMKMGVCHCSMCRSWTGGVFMSVQCDSLTFKDGAPVGVYASSDWGQRLFCTQCGSTLAWQSKDLSHNAVSVQSLEEPSAFEFVSEIFIDEKPDCYAFAGHRKTMTGAEVMAAFASAESE
ncbi:MAG: GFA family protein [Parvularcula sp.]